MLLSAQNIFVSKGLLTVVLSDFVVEYVVSPFLFAVPNRVQWAHLEKEKKESIS